MSKPILSPSKKIGQLIYVSGQVGFKPGTKEFAGEDVKSQAAQAAANIEAVLSDYNIGMENIVKANCYLTDMANYDKFNEAYGEKFVSAPVRTCVAVKTLPFGALCEIEVIASLEKIE